MKTSLKASVELSNVMRKGIESIDFSLAVSVVDSIFFPRNRDLSPTRNSYSICPRERTLELGLKTSKSAWRSNPERSMDLRLRFLNSIVGSW